MLINLILKLKLVIKYHRLAVWISQERQRKQNRYHSILIKAVEELMTMVQIQREEGVVDGIGAQVYILEV
jgi:hypothetical protein